MGKLKDVKIQGKTYKAHKEGKKFGLNKYVFKRRGKEIIIPAKSKEEAVKRVKKKYQKKAVNEFWRDLGKESM